jgi:hypothetical protein
MFAISIIIKGGTLLTMTQYQKYVFLQYRLSRDYKTQNSNKSMEEREEDEEEEEL